MKDVYIRSKYVMRNETNDINDAINDAMKDYLRAVLSYKITGLDKKDFRQLDELKKILKKLKLILFQNIETRIKKTKH